MHIHKSPSISGRAVVARDSSLRWASGGMGSLSNDAWRIWSINSLELQIALRGGTTSSGNQSLGPPGRSSGCALWSGIVSSSSCQLSSNSSPDLETLSGLGVCWEPWLSLACGSCHDEGEGELSCLRGGVLALHSKSGIASCGDTGGSNSGGSRTRPLSSTGPVPSMGLLSCKQTSRVSSLKELRSYSDSDWAHFPFLGECKWALALQWGGERTSGRPDQEPLDVDVACCYAQDRCKVWLGTS